MAVGMVGMVGTREGIGRKVSAACMASGVYKGFSEIDSCTFIVKLAELITCKTKSCRESRFFFSSRFPCDWWLGTALVPSAWKL